MRRSRCQDRDFIVSFSQLNIITVRLAVLEIVFFCRGERLILELPELWSYRNSVVYSRRALDISRDIYLARAARSRWEERGTEKGRERERKGQDLETFSIGVPLPIRPRRRRECRVSCNYSPMNFRLFRDLFRFSYRGGSKSAKLSRGYPLTMSTRMGSDCCGYIAELVSIISLDISNLNFGECSLLYNGYLSL